MKYTSIFLLMLISTDGFSQSIPETEFQIRMMEELNLIEVSDGFKECAYTLYLKNANRNDEAFSTGYAVAQECLPQYINQLKFSDDGEKLRKMILDFFEPVCVQGNQAYQSQVNVPGFCNCLREQFDHNIDLTSLISPDFEQSESQQQIAMYCVNQNRQ